MANEEKAGSRKGEWRTSAVGGGRPDSPKSRKKRQHGVPVDNISPYGPGGRGRPRREVKRPQGDTPDTSELD